jgi:chlorobactene glucosyltransferase
LDALVSTLLFAATLFLILRAARQSACVRSLAPGTGELGKVPQVAIIVPARNEAANIATCVGGILAQTYPRDRLTAIIIDDESDDGTGDIARAMRGGDDRIAVIDTPSLPPGWTGKGHACWLGSEAAGHAPDWLCFLDADVAIHPDLLRTAVAAAEAAELDMLSLAPRQILVSFAERLIMPCGFYLLGFSKNLKDTERADLEEAQATGMFMLIRRERYAAAGGHRAVASAISEDTALARAVKRTGGRIAMWDGGALIETRMYSDWRSLRAGIGKNLVDMMGGTIPTMLIAATGVLLAWALVLVPVVELFSGGGGLSGDIALTLAFGALLLAFGFHIGGAFYFRIPLWYGFLFPLGYTAGALTAIDSIRQRMAGKVAWRGRVYPAPDPPAHAASDG